MNNFNKMIKSKVLTMFLVISSFSMAQTAEQRSAKAYCECSKTTEDVQMFIQLMKVGDKSTIDSNFRKLQLSFYNMKGCVAMAVNKTFTKEEAQNLSDEKIYAELEILCPDVSFYLREHARLDEERYNAD